MKRAVKNVSCLLILLASLMAGCSSLSSKKSSAEYRHDILRGTMATYDSEPRLPNGHVDMQMLLDQLTELRVNTYGWLVWHEKTDWEDLKTFLPLARAKNINVWVTLVPPAEAPPHSKKYSEPFQLDYNKWAEEIGKLSAAEPNLVAWNMDDFWYSRDTFAPEKLKVMLQSARKYNPQLAFVPTLYFQNVTNQLAKDYEGLFDAVLFPYMAKSQGGNLTDASWVEPEVKKIKELFGNSVPVIVDVYATPHNKYKDGSSLPYVRETMINSHKSADGVMIYCHQRKDLVPDRFNAVKELFHQWTEK